MPKLNETIQSDRKAINWLHTSFTTGIVVVDNSFQRRSVWVPKNRVRLVETVLKGFPMPEIYLWSGAADPGTGQSIYKIVDGQQRLTAIRDYISDQFPLKSTFLDEDDQQADFANKRFSELPDARKREIWEYSITTRTIPSHVNRDEIVAIFLRLNETDKSLNPQELRNAEFNGEFISNIEEIAELPFWKKHAVFNTSAVRRMGDLQFVSSILMYLRSGVEAEMTQSAINSMYDTYNETYPQKAEDFDVAKNVLSEIDKIFDCSEEVARFFSSAVHLYPLFILIRIRLANNLAISAESIATKLREFAEVYRGNPSEGVVADYRKAATEGTQKRTNREIRIAKLTEWLAQS
jgi:hypothetical protein